MSTLDVLTWAAIAVLVVGSLAVFVWFLRDAARLWRETRGEDDAEG